MKNSPIYYVFFLKLTVILLNTVLLKELKKNIFVKKENITDVDIGGLYWIYQTGPINI